jgi:hypothetical protein
VPALNGDGVGNRAILADLLAGGEPGELCLPSGRFPLAGGLVVGRGWTIRGAFADAGRALHRAPDAEPATGIRTWLYADRPGDGEPLIHVLGSGVAVQRLGLEPAPSDPGPHGGDRGTAVTVGRFLYPEPPEWISQVRLADLEIRANGRRTANAVAVMGAVRDIAVCGLTVHGGCTGLAVHWGGVASAVRSGQRAGVAQLSGPTCHPHELTVTGLRVREAFEGFYLSAVHDVRVQDADLREVDIGFRLLAGDNTDRFHPPGGGVGRRIGISRVSVAWRGRLYGMRVAGWARSAVDGVVTALAYEDVEVSDCRFVALEDDAAPLRSRAPIVLERAYGVVLRDVSVATDHGPPTVRS